MSAELARREQNGLDAKLRYAEMMAQASLLPPAYRKQPANVLLAIEHGEMLGLPPLAAIQMIHIIDGRPAASAGLISALVRRAGHRLRVTGDETSATATVVRSDDPEFTYTATWDLDRAKSAGLLGKTNWRTYPAAMLKARAVSEVARDACQEALCGLTYTADELGAQDDGGEIIHDGFPTAANGALAAHQMTEEEKDAAGLMTTHHRVQAAALERMDQRPAGQQLPRGAVAEEEDPWIDQPAGKLPLQAYGGGGPIVMHFKRLEVTDREERLGYTSRLAERAEGEEVDSTNDLTDDERRLVLSKLSKLKNHAELVALVTPGDAS